MSEHNHEVLANGTLVPTYPVYRALCPMGCDAVKPSRPAPGDSLTPDSRWRKGWTVVANASLPWHSATVEAVDVSGAAFGFSVCAGSPEMAHRMALDLHARLARSSSKVEST